MTLTVSLWWDTDLCLAGDGGTGLVGVALTHTQVVTGAPLQLTRLFTPLSLPLTRALQKQIRSCTVPKHQIHS